MGIPLVAAIALTVACLRRRESAEVSALVAVLVPYCVLLVLEAGIYVSRYEGRINERTMVTLVPPFFVALAVWLDRGMPRARATVIAVAAVALAACFWPVEKLVVSAIVPDSFTPVPLFDLQPARFRDHGSGSCGSPLSPSCSSFPWCSHAGLRRCCPCW